MFKPNLLRAGLACASLLAAPAYADDAQDLQQLKARVAELENARTTPSAPAASGNAFNPKISLILDGGYASYSAQTPPDVPGFLLGEETEGRAEGLSIGETELALEANVDNLFHGWTTIAIGAEGDVGVEEAYVNTLAMPAGLALKFGRFFSDIGYQNHQHAHAWEFADAPLVYRTMLANQYGDDGIQLRWIAPTDLLLEIGGEAMRGAGFPAGGDARDGANAYTAFAHLGGDAGTGGAWRVGLSQLHADADNRLSGEDVQTAFSGRSRLTIVDAVYKWAPDGNPAQRNFVAQAEYFDRRERGALVYDPDGSADASDYSGHQRGYYVQAVYQFMPRWRTGLRYDWLSADNTLGNPAPGTSLEGLADNSRDPQRYSVMADYSPSEFSRVRLQYNRDESRPGGDVDNQILVQYTYSLGSHPAHQF